MVKQPLARHWRSLCSNVDETVSLTPPLGKDRRVVKPTVSPLRPAAYFYPASHVDPGRYILNRFHWRRLIKHSVSPTNRMAIYLPSFLLGLGDSVIPHIDQGIIPVSPRGWLHSWGVVFFHPPVQFSIRLYPVAPTSAPVLLSTSRISDGEICRLTVHEWAAY